MSVLGQPAGARARLDEDERHLPAAEPRQTSAEDDVVELARKLAPARSSANARTLPARSWTDTESGQPFEAATTPPSTGFAPDEAIGTASVNPEASQASKLSVPDLHNARDAGRATQRPSRGWIFKTASIAPAAGAALLGAGLVIVVFGPKAGSHGPPTPPSVVASREVPAKALQGRGETVPTLEDAEAIAVTDVAPVRVVRSEKRPIDPGTSASAADAPATAPSIPTPAAPRPTLETSAGPPVSALVAAASAAASPHPASQSPDAGPERSASAAPAPVDAPAAPSAIRTGKAALPADAPKQADQAAPAESKAAAAQPTAGTSAGPPVSPPVVAASAVASSPARSLPPDDPEGAASPAAAPPEDARAPSVMDTSEAAQPAPGTFAGPRVSSSVAAAPVTAPPSAASQSIDPEHAAAAPGNATAAPSTITTGKTAEPGYAPRERVQLAPATEGKAAVAAQLTISKPDSAAVEAGRPADAPQRPAKPALAAESKAAAVARPATPRLNLRARLSTRPGRVMLERPEPSASAVAPQTESQPLRPAASTTPQAPAAPAAAPPTAAPRAVDPVGHAFGAVAGALGGAGNQNAAPRSGDWALQFSAPKSEAEAQADASRLNARFARRLNGATVGVQKTEVNGQTVYAVRVPGLSKADAAALCDRMKGRDCSAVK